MKKLSLFFLALLSMQLIFAQAPEGIHYQAVIRDGNTIMANQSVDILLGILDANSNIVYEESHNGLTTDQFGTINYVIGKGTVVIGSFDQIDWDQDGLWFLSEATVNGVIYDLGRVDLQSVPYSLYSNYADSARTAGNLTIDGTTPGQLLVWDGMAWVANEGTEVMDSTISTNNVEGSNWSATKDADGDGKYESHGPNGSLNISLRGYLFNRDHGFIGLYDQAGSQRIDLHAGSNSTGGSNAGSIRTFGPNGSTNVSISTSTVDGNAGRVSVVDDQGDNKVSMEIDSDGTGNLRTSGPSGGTNTVLGSLFNREYGFIGAYDSTTLRASISGVGEVFSMNANGTIIARMSGGPTTTTSDRGSISVFDQNGGMSQAGMFVDATGDGIVFGDVKNFRIPHPNNPEKEIWYASLEGPEAGAYVRGTAQLINGEAVVNFPEHFAAIANSQTMTVVLTPLSASSEGMAVIEKTATGFQVKELHQGAGNYQFDWEVKCVRSGYENYRAVRDASEYRETPIEKK